MYCCKNHDTNHGNDAGVGCTAVDQLVALLVNDPQQKRQTRSDTTNNDQFWDGIEASEANELLQFRTGDAAPS